MSLPNFLKVYQRCHSIPFLGPFLFTQYIRFVTPYSASISPHITQLEPGHCQLKIYDRAHLRNPFQSIHALALLNAGELATGLALLTFLQHPSLGCPNKRAIVTHLRGQFLKKARGEILVKCHVSDTLKLRLKESNFQGTITVHSELKNLQGDKVALTEVDWAVK